MATPTIVFGGGILTPPYVKDADETEEYLKLLEELDVKIIDTAALYGESEKYLGENGAPKRFTIDTKHPGIMNSEPSTKDVVIASGKESLRRLGTSQVRSPLLSSNRHLACMKKIAHPESALDRSMYTIFTTRTPALPLKKH